MFFLAVKHSDDVVIMLMNVKMSTMLINVKMRTTVINANYADKC